MNPVWDVATVRRDFPILGDRLHGRPLTWLDNAATTQKPRAVIDRLVHYYEHENANVHRSGSADQGGCREPCVECDRDGTSRGEMIHLAHRHGARVFVDGAQAAHLSIDVQLLDADFYAFSGHKAFGPTGIGALYIKSSLQAAMAPWQWGGSMVTQVTFEETGHRDGPARFEAGTGHIAGAVGLAAALDYTHNLGQGPAQQHERDLTRYALESLRAVNTLRLIGDPRDRVGVISFVIDGLSSEDVGVALDQDGVAVRAGNHCAQPALHRLGHHDSIRASLAFYNTREEVDVLTASLRHIVNRSTRSRVSA